MPSLADRCVERFILAKKEGRKLSMEEVRNIITEEENAQKKTKPQGTTQVLAKLADVEWIAYLEKLPHLQGVDIKREIGRAQLYWGERKRECTRRHIVNWLNRAEKTVTYQAHGQSSFAPKSAASVPEPSGWREAFPDCIHGSWAAMPRDSQAHIAKQMSKPALPQHFTT